MREKISESVAIILLFLLALACVFLDGKVTKKSVADFFKITRPTLAKWIQYFPGAMPASKWARLRYLRRFDVINIKEHFGSDTDYVLSKRQIFVMAGSNYKTVAENVKLNLDKIGISEEAWNSLNIFPPNISKKILQSLG